MYHAFPGDDDLFKPDFDDIKNIKAPFDSHLLHD